MNGTTGKQVGIDQEHVWGSDTHHKAANVNTGSKRRDVTDRLKKKGTGE